MTPVVQIELNEVNFDFVRAYMDSGALPNFAELIGRYGVAETASEERYEELEPWIQWVTAHTGLTFAEHGVFRLGDIVKRTDLVQIWEQLEGRGHSVAAMSPMNAHNAVREAPFFVPDPWTDTRFSGGPGLERLYQAIRQTVNDNASGRLAPSSAWHLARGVLSSCRTDEFADLLRLAGGAVRGRWRKSIFLDMFLAALFLRLWEKHRPDFATLFLNGAAHIQHHYIFSSGVYDGPHRNPAWYVPEKADPLLEVYQAYDRILGRVLARAPGARVILATGLHQDPEPDPIYYWRPKNHARLLEKLGITFESVEPRMSRDFLVHFATPQDLARAENVLDAIQLSGKSVFQLETRGSELFAQLVYPDALREGSFLEGPGDAGSIDLFRETAFVALKNGRHNGIGYLVDTQTPGLDGRRMPLAEMPRLVS